MAPFATHAELALPHLNDYMPLILDRLSGFDTAVLREGPRTEFAFPEGKAAFIAGSGALRLGRARHAGQ